jgi:DNA repair protein RecO (recombination protein O)
VHIQKEKVIILKKTKYSESDLIIQALNSKGAKLSFIAKGALKSKRRFAGGVLEPTHYVQVIYKKVEGKLAFLEEATVIDDFSGLRTDYDRLALSLEIVGIMNSIAQEEDQHAEPLFNLLGHSLKSLQKCKDVQFFKLSFLLKLLHQQGVLLVEPWMRPIFVRSLNDSDAAKAECQAEVVDRLKYFESQLSTYISTASRH